MAKKQGGPIRVPIKPPIKGVNRNLARGSQPEGTTYDALNILPIDRQGRLRLAQRAGLGRQTTLDAAAKVRLLHVASTIVNS